MTKWSDIKARCGAACFISDRLVADDDEGDTPPQPFDTPEEAEAWAEKALKAGRFKRIIIWDGITGSWLRHAEFTADDF